MGLSRVEITLGNRYFKAVDPVDCLVEVGSKAIKRAPPSSESALVDRISGAN